MSIAAATLSLPFAAPPPHIRRRRPLSASTSAFLTDSHSGLLAKMGGVRVSSRSRGRGLQVSCLFGLGVPELVVIAGVAALVFGPKKLPEIGRSIGKTVKSFQQAAKELETELKQTQEEESDEPSTEKSISAGENQKQEKVKNLEATSQKESV